MVLASIMASHQANALMPYTSSSLWDIMLLPTASEDPFRTAHVISLDIPGTKKEDIKIEVEENRALRISGEGKGENEVEGEKWHRAERTNGKFWRQFRLPNIADIEHFEAHLEDGVLRITLPKFGEEQKRQPKVINIVEQASSAQDIKATKAEM